MYGNMANSTLGRVELEAEVERNLGGAELGGKREHGGVFFKDPPCLDINIHLDILI